MVLWPGDMGNSLQGLSRNIPDFCRDMNYSIKRKKMKETAWMEKLLSKPGSSDAAVRRRMFQMEHWGSFETRSGSAGAGSTGAGSTGAG